MRIRFKAADWIVSLCGSSSGLWTTSRSRSETHGRRGDGDHRGGRHVRSRTVAITARHGRPPLRIAVAALSVTALIIGAAPPARAEPACVNPIDPDDLGERTFCIAEHVEISARAGDRFHVQGRLVLEDAEARLLVSDGLRCEPPGGRQAVTSQNMYAGQQQAVLNARYIWTAPADGDYVCEMLVRVAYVATNMPVADVRIEGTGTRLTVDRVAPWSQDKYQDKERIVSRTKAWDLVVMTWTAPEGVDAFTLTGDVELTNCYNQYQGSNRTDGVACATVPSNSRPAKVETRLQAQQYAGGGGYCRTTSGPSDPIEVSWAVHHKKNYHRIAEVPVSDDASCTRRFRLKVYARWVSGNPVLVEQLPFSNIYVHGSG